MRAYADARSRCASPTAFVERLVEARPAGAAVVLGRRVEERQRAAGAIEGALAMLVEQRRADRAARSRPRAARRTGSGVELCAPLGLGQVKAGLAGGRPSAAAAAGMPAHGKGRDAKRGEGGSAKKNCTTIHRKPPGCEIAPDLGPVRCMCGASLAFRQAARTSKARVPQFAGTAPMVTSSAEEPRR